MNTTLKDKWSMNVPPEGKASQNKRRKRESLLNNAFELFTQKGITDTTISDIVEKAGVAKGTFYLYFKDKYDLRDRLVRHKAELILEKAYELFPRRPAPVLPDSIRWRTRLSFSLIIF